MHLNLKASSCPGLGFYPICLLLAGQLLGGKVKLFAWFRKCSGGGGLGPGVWGASTWFHQCGGDSSIGGYFMGLVGFHAN